MIARGDRIVAASQWHVLLLVVVTCGCCLAAGAADAAIATAPVGSVAITAAISSKTATLRDAFLAKANITIGNTIATTPKVYPAILGAFYTATGLEVIAAYTMGVGATQLASVNSAWKLWSSTGNTNLAASLASDFQTTYGVAPTETVFSSNCLFDAFNVTTVSAMPMWTTPAPTAATTAAPGVAVCDTAFTAIISANGLLETTRTKSLVCNALTPFDCTKLTVQTTGQPNPTTNRYSANLVFLNIDPQTVLVELISKIKTSSVLMQLDVVSMEVSGVSVYSPVQASANQAGSCKLWWPYLLIVIVPLLVVIANFAYQRGKSAGKDKAKKQAERQNQRPGPNGSPQLYGAAYAMQPVMGQQQQLQQQQQPPLQQAARAGGPGRPPVVPGGATTAQPGAGGGVRYPHKQQGPPRAAPGGHHPQQHPHPQHPHPQQPQHQHGAAGHGAAGHGHTGHH